MAKKERSIQELLDAATKPGQVKFKEIKESSAVSTFLVDFNIIPGYTTYNRQFLYLLYCYWNKYRSKPLATEKLFYRILKTKFKATVRGHKYYINEEELKYNREEMEKFIVETIMKRARENVKKIKKEEKPIES